MSSLSYEARLSDGDQKNFKSDSDNKPAEPYENAPENAHKLNDYHDQHSLAERAKNEKLAEKAEKRAEEADAPLPTAAAKAHGNKPSRGAEIDEEIMKEEEQLLKDKGIK